VPVVRPLSLKLTVWPVAGIGVGDTTGKKEGPGQGEVEVP